MKKLLSIQGVFFQGVFDPFIAQKPGIGTAVALRKIVEYSMYYAIVYPHDTHDDIFVGAMSDRYGYSTITELKISDTELSFTKTYDGRPPIYYSFTKTSDNTWEGTWQGTDCGNGTSRCIITEIDESFLLIDEETEERLLSAIK